jgi:hypothetical protein
VLPVSPSGARHRFFARPGLSASKTEQRREAMSAWVVTKHHIDVLVSAAIERAVAIKLEGAEALVPVTPENATFVGRMLLRENIASVVYRYRLCGTDEAFDYLRGLVRYKFTFYPAIRASAVAQGLECYDYQACEHDTYETSAAAFFVAQLRTALGGEEGTNADPWGFDSEEEVLAVSSAAVTARSA